MHTTSLHQPPPQPVTVTLAGFAFALLAHLLLAVVLWIGVSWQQPSHSGIEAEIWTEIPPPAAFAPVTKPAPVLDDQKARAVQEQLEAEAEIALRQAREREQLEEKKRQEELRLQQEKQEREERAQREREKLEQKKREEQAARRIEQQKKAEKEREKREAEQRKIEQQKIAQRERQQYQQQQEQQRQQRAAEKQKQLQEQRRLAQQQKSQRASNERAEQARAAQLARLRRVVDEAGSGGSMGAASGSGSAGRANYADRVRARVRPHIIFDTDSVSANVAAIITVELAPDGTILAKRLAKSSGHSDWDEAVLLGLERASPLPRQADGKVPPSLTITFKIRD